MKIGVCGLGSIGLRHALNAKKQGCDVFGFDPDKDRQKQFEGLGGTFAGSVEELLNLSQGLVIASPNRFHRENLKQAIRAGRHVLIEKPLATSLSGLSELIEQAAQENLIIAPAMNLRFHPVTNAVRNAVTQGGLGKTLWARFQCSSYLPDWRPHQDYRQNYTSDPKTGGVIFDIIHEIDLAQYILGLAETQSCSAWQSQTLETGAEDCAEILLKHDDNTRSAIHLDYVSRPPRRGFEIQFESGLAQGDLLSRRLTLTDSKRQIVSDENFPGSFDEDYKVEMWAFLDAVNGRAAYPCTAQEALHVLQTAITARKLAGLPQEED